MSIILGFHLSKNIYFQIIISNFNVPTKKDNSQVRCQKMLFIFIFRKDTMHILLYNSFVSYQCEAIAAFEILFDYDKYNKVQQ